MFSDAFGLLSSSFMFQEEDDTNYQEEAEVADVFDSDFDEDVSSAGWVMCCTSHCN